MTGLESVGELLAVLGLGLGWLGMVQGPVPGDEAMRTDAELVLAVQGGDPSAYRGLVEKYQGRIYTMVYGVVRDREDAADITQDAFIKAFRKLDSFRADARFYTWVYRIAMNAAIDFTRRRQRSPLQGLDEDLGVRDADRGIEDADRIDGPQRMLERKQLHGAILAALDQLSEEHKVVVLLREVEGMAYRDIAETLDVAEGTVMSRLFYARKRLQLLLSDARGGGDGSE